jgi:hypothetical protein
VCTANTHAWGCIHAPATQPTCPLDHTPSAGSIEIFLPWQVGMPISVSPGAAVGSGLLAPGACTRAAHPNQDLIVCQRHLPRPRHLPPPIRPTSEMVWWGARKGRVVTRAACRAAVPTAWMPRVRPSAPIRRHSPPVGFTSCRYDGPEHRPLHTGRCLQPPMGRRGDARAASWAQTGFLADRRPIR